ncbi:MAG: hypothetical protein IPJ65_24335 [Archangiaceae bacterium]|nr:hypothetical protein [Archangiaceae bacterium]
MLLQLSLIATEQAPAREALEDWKKRIEARDASMENYVDFLLEQPGFINVTAPFLLVRDWAFATQQTPPLNALLKALSRPGMKEPVYYRWLPCAPEQAVRVTPWWGKDPVLVCPDSYRPEVFVDGMHFCDGGVAQDKFDSKLDGVRQICGCGPNLMRCFLTVEQMNRARDAMPEEVRATVAHLVTENQPVELLTSNETFRTREAEFFYQRERVEAGLQSELADLSSWPEQGQWAPRPEARAGATRRPAHHPQCPLLVGRSTHGSQCDVRTSVVLRAFEHQSRGEDDSVAARRRHSSRLGLEGAGA